MKIEVSPLVIERTVILEYPDGDGQVLKNYRGTETRIRRLKITYRFHESPFSEWIAFRQEARVARVKKDGTLYDESSEIFLGRDDIEWLEPLVKEHRPTDVVMVNPTFTAQGGGSNG